MILWFGVCERRVEGKRKQIISDSGLVLDPWVLAMNRSLLGVAPVYGHTEPLGARNEWMSEGLEAYAQGNECLKTLSLWANVNYIWVERQSSRCKKVGSDGQMGHNQNRCTTTCLATPFLPSVPESCTRSHCRLCHKEGSDSECVGRKWKSSDCMEG